MDNFWDRRLWNLFRPLVGPLLVLRRDVQTRTALQPSAVVLPARLMEAAGGETAIMLGLPVIWDERDDAVVGLVYDAQNRDL